MIPHDISAVIRDVMAKNSSATALLGEICKMPYGARLDGSEAGNGWEIRRAEITAGKGGTSICQELSL